MQRRCEKSDNHGRKRNRYHNADDCSDRRSRGIFKPDPELLPVLKEVGVVDSGGKGLLCVYEGFLASLKGETVPQKAVLPSLDDMVSAEHHKSAQSMMNTEDIEFGFVPK